MLLSTQVTNKIFNTLAIFLSIAACYHLFGIFFKVDHSPIWKNATFAGIDLFCTYGLIKRPNYFIIFFIAFTIQQFFSHAPYLFQTWISQHTIHWNSVFVLTILPVGLVFLIVDYFSHFDNLISFNEMEDQL